MIAVSMAVRNNSSSLCYLTTRPTPPPPRLMFHFLKAPELRTVATRGEIYSLKFTKYRLGTPFLPFLLISNPYCAHSVARYRVSTIVDHQRRDIQCILTLKKQQQQRNIHNTLQSLQMAHIFETKFRFCNRYRYHFSTVSILNDSCNPETKLL